MILYCCISIFSCVIFILWQYFIPSLRIILLKISSVEFNIIFLYFDFQNWMICQLWIVLTQMSSILFSFFLLFIILMIHSLFLILLFDFFQIHCFNIFFQQICNGIIFWKILLIIPLTILYYVCPKILIIN